MDMQLQLYIIVLLTNIKLIVHTKLKLPCIYHVDCVVVLFSI